MDLSNNTEISRALFHFLTPLLIFYFSVVSLPYTKSFLDRYTSSVHTILTFTVFTPKNFLRIYTKFITKETLTTNSYIKLNFASNFVFELIRVKIHTCIKYHNRLCNLARFNGQLRVSQFSVFLLTRRIEMHTSACWLLVAFFRNCARIKLW